MSSRIPSGPMIGSPRAFPISNRHERSATCFASLSRNGAIRDTSWAFLICGRSAGFAGCRPRYMHSRGALSMPRKRFKGTAVSHGFFSEMKKYLDVCAELQRSREETKKNSSLRAEREARLLSNLLDGRPTALGLCGLCGD